MDYTMYHYVALQFAIMIIMLGSLPSSVCETLHGGPVRKQV